MKKSRNLSVDILKVISSFFVILHHSLLPVFQVEKYSMNWFRSSIVVSLASVAVPVFLLCSGYLMFNNKTNYSKTFKKTIVTFSILAGMSIAYLTILKGVSIFDFKTIIISLYSKASPSSYWYLYFYLGLLIISPILNKLFNVMDIKDHVYLILVSLLTVGVIPLVLARLKMPALSVHFIAPLPVSFIIYIIIGNFIYKYQNQIRSIRNIGFYSFVSFAISWIIIVILLRRDQISGAFPLTFWSNRTYLPIIVLSVSMFMFFFTTFNNINSKIIQYLSKSTFVVYLLGDFVLLIGLNSFYKPIYKTFRNPFVNRMLLGITVYLVALFVAVLFVEIKSRVINSAFERKRK